MPVADTKSPMERAIRAQRALPGDIREVKYCEYCKEPMYRTPILTCSHCGKVLKLRCYTYKSGDLFYSECIDLDLMARGRTKEEAIGLLQEEIFTYLDAALDGDRVGLIPRRAPLSNRLRYFGHLFVARIKRLFRPHSSHRDYDFQDLGVTFSAHC
jgi:hypothetical protein